jgi:hypothetical protein
MAKLMISKLNSTSAKTGAPIKVGDPIFYARGTGAWHFSEGEAHPRPSPWVSRQSSDGKDAHSVTGVAPTPPVDSNALAKAMAVMAAVEALTQRVKDLETAVALFMPSSVE